MPAAEDRPLSRQQRYALAAALVLVALVAAYTRCVNWAGVFRNGQVFFPGLDSHYHLRRLHHILADYPHVPDFDGWCNFPEGARQVWSKGFDLVLATLCKAVGLIDDAPQTIEATAALFGPLLGVGLCLMVFVLARRMGGALAGVVAALLAAVLPALSGYANIGRVDHHAAEPYLVVVPLWLLVRAIEAPSARRARRAADLAGGVLALTLAVWSGAIVVGALAFSSLGLAAVLGWGTTPTRLAFIGERSFGVAALVALPLCAWHPWMAIGSFDYFALSWFQPLCFAIAWGTFLAVRMVGTQRLRRAVALALAPAVLGGVALLALTGLRTTMLDAAGYLGRGETQISQVTESLPLLGPGWGIATDLYSVLLLLGFVPLIYPALRTLGWWARQLPEPRRTGWALAHLWLLVTAVLAFKQMRLGSLFAPLFCVWWGVIAGEAYRWLVHRTRFRCVPPALGLFALAAVMAPLAPQHVPAEFSGTEQFVRSYGALGWLRQQAASPGDAADPRSRPAFGVMARWQWGHWLTYLAGQANIANPFGQAPTHIEGVARSARFFLSRDPSAALAMLASLRVRYVLVTPVLAELEGVAAHTGAPAGTFVRGAAAGKRQLAPAYFESVNTRLLYYDGLAIRLGDTPLAPFRNLRLVFESGGWVTEVDHRFLYAKVFERVPGALLEGVAPPGASVLVQAQIRTNSGRRFFYQDRVQAGEDWSYALRVPYASVATAGVTAEGGYRLWRSHQLIGHVQVSELDVREGRTVDVVAIPDAQ